MAPAKYTRLDARRSSAASSSCWSTLMIVAFSGVCLVGIWIMNSSSPIIVTVDDSDMSSGVIMKNGVSTMAKKYVGGNGKNEDTNNNNNNNSKNNENEDDDSNQFEEDGDSPPNKEEEEEEEEGGNNNNNSNQQNSTAVAENAIVEENKKDRKRDESDNGSGQKIAQQTSKHEKKQGNDQLIQQPVEEKNDDNLNQAAAVVSGDNKNDQQFNQAAAANPGNTNDQQLNQAVIANSGDRNDQQFNQAAAASSNANDQQLNQAAAANSGDKNDQQLNQAAAANSGDKNDQQLNQAAAANSGDKNDQQLNQGAASVEKNDQQLNQAAVAASGEKIDAKLNQGGPGDHQNPNEVLYPSGAESGLLKETTTQNGSFSTQAQESKNEKEIKEEVTKPSGGDNPVAYNWKLCKTSAWADYIPCLDNLEAIRQLTTNVHYEHRERHCPANPPTCLVPLPEGYRRSIEWPTSRDKIWFHNVPHTELVQYKSDQHWVKYSGEYLTFPGGGTQFKSGALHYIDFIQQSVPEIAWGKHTRVILDVGCGVASFGGYLFDRKVLTMSIAPKDEHEAQVQFALERGIPAMSAVMGTKRLSFPGSVFDVVHCARCRVPWHADGGMLLLELDRLLRPGGFFLWSATPVYKKDGDDPQIWEAMQKLTKSICWELVKVSIHKRDRVGLAVYRKPVNNQCYEQRQQNEPPLCSQSDDPNAAWHVSLQACLHKVPVAASERGSQWPEEWPSRLDKPPYWLAATSQVGVYGNPAEQDFTTDARLWHNVFYQSYLNGIGVNWTSVRNVMDMRAIYGGFAAALRDINVWVMNVVNIFDPDTLPIIYDRGLFGVYHDWCESFSTYPRSYDLLHANHLFSIIKKRCNYLAFIAEVDRILRPEGSLIVRDTVETINELEAILRSMQWEIRMAYSHDKEGLLCAHKTMWRPNELETLTYAVG